MLLHPDHHLVRPHGHDPADIEDRRAAQPWYRTKTEPETSVKTAA
jgi:hypothetical protein